MPKPIFIFILLFICKCLHAQLPYAIHVDKSQGLPDNEIYEIKQDQNGYIWISAQTGLYRYDGHHYKNYQFAAQYARAGNTIRFDPYGRVWYISFDHYLYYIENDTLKQFNQKINASDIFTYDICGTNLYYIQKNEIVVRRLKDFSIAAKYPSNIDSFGTVRTTNEKVYFLYGNKIRCFDSSGKQTQSDVAFREGLSNIIHTPKGYYISIGSNSIPTSAGKIENNQYHTVLRSKQDLLKIENYQDNIYFIVNNEVLKYNENTDKQAVPIFHSNRPSCLYQDNRQNIWIGTLDDGIYMIPNLNAVYYPIPFGTISYSTIVGKHLLMADKQANIYTLADKKLQLISNTGINNEVYDIKLAPNEILSSQNKLSYQFKHGGQLYHLASRGSKKIAPINAHYYAFAYSGACYITTYNNKAQSASKWDAVFRQYPAIPSVPNTRALLHGVRAKSAIYTAKQKLIFATNQGLYEIDSTSTTTILFNKQNIYSSSIEEYNNKCYILTNGGELLIRNENNEIHKLSSKIDFVKFKRCDSLLFLFSKNALYKINLTKQIAEQKYLEQLNFSIPTEEIEDIAFYNNEYYLFTKNGMTISNYLSQKNNYPFLIQSIHSGAKTGRQFNSDENDIEVSFSILDYLQPNSHSIQYRINNEEWKNLDADQRTLKLSALTAGDYTIDFMLDNVQQPNKAMFTVLKPWWRSNLAILFFLSLIAAVIVLIYKWRIRLQIKQSKLELEKLKLQNSLDKSLLSSIKSQMNPHFLFNALNTIQSFIVSEDKKNASTYLSKFSKLTRKILEMSEQEKVSLTQELDSLKLYLDLEKMRFNDLQFHIHLPEQLNTDAIFIPSMLIQPYVENAIKHGLLHKSNSRQLAISVEQTNSNNLKIKIDDNGIGRHKSAEINKQKKHRSFANDANLKRIELLNKTNNNVGIEIVDKVDNNGDAAGTTITIHLPI